MNWNILRNIYLNRNTCFDCYWNTNFNWYWNTIFYYVGYFDLYLMMFTNYCSLKFILIDYFS